MGILNVTNGDQAANTLKASTISGDVLIWRDPMHHGPFPSGLNEHELCTVRAQHLAGTVLDVDEVERNFRLRDEHLNSSKKYGQVILWFEHDLLDQLQVLQILDRLGSLDLGSTSIEMICIDKFPNIHPFRGLGQLDATQMASLYDHRTLVDEAMITLAKLGWSAFCSNNPEDLLNFTNGNLRALPFLHSALIRHFEEYPSSLNGLTRTEHQLLTLVSNGITDPIEIFLENMACETTLYIGDWHTYFKINELIQSGLLICEPAPFQYPPKTAIDRHAMRNQRLNLTDAGTQLLKDEADAFVSLDRDFWLGGVHFKSGKCMWTWSSEANRLIKLDR